LASPEASRTGEWREGIGRLTEARLSPDVQALVAPYLAAVAATNAGTELRRYPGSPLIALNLMRPQDRLVACELEPDAATALAANLRHDARASAVAIDGWTALNAYVPPKERRGLVLIDPPFEDPDDFPRLALALEAAHRKWAGGTYLLWYPIKERAAPDALARRLRRSGIAKILRAELSVHRSRVSPRSALDTSDTNRLDACALVVVNPPWTLAAELALLLPELAAVLSDDGRGTFRVDWLASEK
jgi:23S rRNA (adenine2030-N6)-methyltransferase